MNHNTPSTALLLAAKAARAADRVLTVLTRIALMLVIVYASYAMWDNYRILGLSTCSDASSNARVIVFGLLTCLESEGRPGETAIEHGL